MQSPDFLLLDAFETESCDSSNSKAERSLQRKDGKLTGRAERSCSTLEAT